jgi:hypothetical protein
MQSAQTNLHPGALDRDAATRSLSRSPRVFTREKWFVRLGMAAHGIAWHAS